jgi:hypothetical protein
MTPEEFDREYDAGNLDDAYADFLMEHSAHHIGNGDMLIAAMEGGYLYEEFRESMVK